MDSRGRPKPLPAALLMREGRGWRLIANLKLKHFNEICVRELLDREVGSYRRVCIAFDIAIGLPAEMSVSYEQLLRKARGFTFEGREYGSSVAHDFYQSFLREANWVPSRDGEKWPVRRAEVAAGANSVFQRYPFQKNVACGSFRALKEFAADPFWCAVWPFQKVEGDQQFLLAESYPSLLWRELLGAKTRDSHHLVARLAELFPRQEFGMPLGPDAADAAVLALGTRILVEERGALAQDLSATIRAREGWILGLREAGDGDNGLGRRGATAIDDKKQRSRKTP